MLLKTWQMGHLPRGRMWGRLQDSDSDFSSFFPGSWAGCRPPTSGVLLGSIHLPPFTLLPPWFWSPSFHVSYHNSFLSGLPTSATTLVKLTSSLQPKS